MASVTSQTVSRQIDKAQSGGASRPYRARYRISWPDEPAALATAGKDKSFVLERTDCDDFNNEKVDSTSNFGIRADAEEAAEKDCGRTLKWK